VSLSNGFLKERDPELVGQLSVLGNIEVLERLKFPPYLMWQY